MVRRRTFLAILLSIGSGGCLRLSQDESTATPGATASSTPGSTTAGGPATQTGTATATPPPEPTPDSPLGISDAGLKPLVADAHTSALAGRSFTIEFQHTDVVDGDRRLDTMTRYRDNRTQAASYDGLIRGLVNAGLFDTVRRTETDGQVRFSATASQPSDGGTQHLPWWIAREGDRVESFSGEATIRASGIVESLTATLEVVRDDRLETHRSQLHVTDVGSTTLDMPSWVQTA